MTTYVLVGGAWLGGWCWRRVARRLRKNGHDVYPVTLTGLGERARLASPGVDLETHITDVVNLFEYEDIRDAVLLGTATPASWSRAPRTTFPSAWVSWCTLTPRCSRTGSPLSRRSRPR